MSRPIGLVYIRVTSSAAINSQYFKLADNWHLQLNLVNKVALQKYIKPKSPDLLLKI